MKTERISSTRLAIDRNLLRASWQAWISSDRGRGGGPWWLPWIWTVLFAAALAFPFTVLGFWAYGSGEGAWRNLPGWALWYGKNFIVTLTVAAIIHLLFDLGRVVLATPARLARWRPWQRSTYFAGVPMLGVLLGWPLGLTLAGANLMDWVGTPEGTNTIVGTVLASLTITLLMHTYFASRHREIVAERRATEAQLRLLQAQIEPHFLFNTLANVQSLMDHDPPKARAMLSSFTDYLRATLGTLRSETSTVGHELDLAQSYLQLLQTRMEDRLRFEIDTDAAARQLPLPSLLLQPLVENAVMHGLEPSIEGGCVQVRAHVADGRLVLSVQDDGRGLDAARRPGSRGNGMALANIRERLQARYGSAARLHIEAAHPGTLATVTLPLEAA
jgi:signal transduction histidine kinase